MNKKTYVLVHGAYHGGWCWRAVADLLCAQGHRVFTPTLTGLGERAHLLALDPDLNTHIDDIVQVIASEELSDVILVGHSYGGGVISGVVDRIPEKIAQLIYLDALVLAPGSAVLEHAPEETLAFYRSRTRAEGGDGVIPCPPASFFGIDSPEQIAWLERRLTPHPILTFMTPLQLQNPLGNGRPAAYIVCTDPQFTQTEPSRALAKAQGWKFYEIATGHNAMMSAPRELVDLFARIIE